MKKFTQEDLNKIVSKICSEKYSREDIKLLLFEIRDHLGKRSQLRDIANCIHPERDRGNAFEMIKDHVERFIGFSKKRGELVVTHIYDSKRLIVELVNSLKNERFEFDEKAFVRQTSGIIKAISEFLDGTKINLKNNSIRDCVIKIMKDESGKEFLCFHFNLSQPISGVLKVPTNVAIAMPFFK